MECSRCKDWFYQTCKHIPDNVVGSDSEWATCVLVLLLLLTLACILYACSYMYTIVLPAGPIIPSRGIPFFKSVITVPSEKNFF